MEQKEVEESFWELFVKVYQKCKEQVNFFLLGIASLLNFFSSALEAISLGLVVPLLEKVLNNQTTDMGIVQKALDYLSLTQKTEIISAVAIMILISVIFKNIFSYASGWINRNVNNNISYALQTKVIKTYLDRDYIFFEKNKVGELQYKLGLSSIFPGVISRINAMVIRFFFCLSYGIMMFYISYQISAFIIIVFIPLYIIIRWVRSMIISISQLLVKVGNELSLKTYEILSSIHLIKLYSTENEENKRYEQLRKQSRDLSNGLGNRSSLITALQEPIMTFGVMAIAGISYFYFVGQAKGGIAGLLAYFVILKRFQSELQNLVSQIPAFSQDKPKLKEFLKVFKEEPWMIIKSGKIKFEKLKKGITFKNLYFRYNDSDDWVLKNITTSIPKGKTTAIVGPSGSGKTTLVELIPRIFDHNKGKIFVDGIDMKKYDAHTLRKKIGVVSQDVAILNRSVRDNIIYGLERKVDDKELVECTKKAGIYDFIKKMPEGFDSLLGERGMNLSGGQRQRISIARAILKNPEILILDEATSALDTETEKKIQKAFESLAKGRTVIAIAHRLSTIQNADKVIVIERGTVTEQGGFKELLKRKKRFYHYWNMQK